MIRSDEDGVWLRAGDDDVVTLSSSGDPALLERMLALLDGQRSLPKLLADLANVAEEESVLCALGVLKANGLLEEGEQPENVPGELADWVQAFLHPETVQELEAVLLHIAAARIAVVGAGDLGRDIAASLTRHGIDVIEARGVNERDLTMAIVAPDRYDSELFSQVNQWALTQRMPWLLVTCASESHATVGPFFVPGETCCYHCFEQRLQSNRANCREHLDWEALVKNVDADASQRRRLAPLVVPCMRNALAEWAVLETLKHLVPGASPVTIGHCVEIDFGDCGMITEPVWRLPWCPACAPGDSLPRPSPWTFRPSGTLPHPQAHD